MNSKPYSVGIDIGGTNTVFGIVDRNGKVIAKDSIKTKGYPNFKSYLDVLYDALTKLIKRDIMEKISTGTLWKTSSLQLI